MSQITNKILYEISVERKAQDAEHGGPEHDDTHSQAEWIALLMRHGGLAVNGGSPYYGNVDSDRFRKQMVRCAALCVAAVESFDRKAKGCVGPMNRGPGY